MPTDPYPTSSASIQVYFIHVHVSITFRQCRLIALRQQTTVYRQQGSIQQRHAGYLDSSSAAAQKEQYLHEGGWKDTSQQLHYQP